MSQQQKNFGVVSKTMTLADQATVDFRALDYVYLLEATGTIHISDDGSAFAPLPLRSGLMGRHAWRGESGSIGNVVLKNLTGAPVTFTIQTGFGAPMDNRGGTAGGTQAVSITASSIDLSVKGADAHDAVATDPPVTVAGEARSSERAAVASGDVARLVTDLVGRLIVAPFANPENLTDGASAACAGVGGTAQIIAAGAAGVRTTLHTLTVHETGGVASEWELLDGATVRWRGYIAANGPTQTVTFPGGLRGTAATAWNIRQVAAAGVKACAAGHQGT